VTRSAAFQEGGERLRESGPVPELAVSDAPIRRHVGRWTDRVSRRIRARDPERRPVWDHRLFLEELYADVPAFPPSAAVELADAFERAIREARGSSARFDRAAADL
jgi:hypothetical protein